MKLELVGGGDETDEILSKVAIVSLDSLVTNLDGDPGKSLGHLIESALVFG